MTRVEEYRQQLRRLQRWEPFLRRHSGLPGPRGNLELATAAALEATPEKIATLLALPIEEAPENSPGVFLVFCGVLALGRLFVEGDQTSLRRLRPYASDPRWRVREAVAMALQTIGDSDPDSLVRVARQWSAGNWYEMRAAAAGIAEPRLLKSETMARDALRILDGITASIAKASDRKDEAFRALRQGMGYCWSVVVAAQPAKGKPFLERWLKIADPDVRWLLKENFKKNRLAKVDPQWVKSCLARLDA